MSFASSIVIAVIINLAINDRINISNLLQFVYVDVAIFVVVLFMYKKFIKHAKNINFPKIAERITRKELTLIIVLLLGQAIITFSNVSWNGSSRIEYQTEKWFTFVKLISQIVNPLSCFLVFLLIKCKRVHVAIFIATIIIVTSALAGSKAGFIVGFLEMFLLYRDLVGISKREVKILGASAVVLVVAAIINLYFLDITTDKLFLRFVDYAEATIMVYPSDDPTAACKNTSMLANIHRGIARFLHDPTALDVDTLFGYSLTIEFYGVNTYTGPNARIGAYALCAFPGWYIFILYAVIAFYFILSWIVYRIYSSRGGLACLMICPFFVNAINQSVLDYNTAMALLTQMIFLMLFIVLEPKLQIIGMRVVDNDI